MGWTAPRTWVAGEVVTKALLDEQIRDNELVLHSPIYSLLPRPVPPIVGAGTSQALPANNTSAHVGVIMVPRPILVTAIRYNISAAGGGATSAVRIALYTEDGQTRVINEVDVCGANVGIRVLDVTPDVELEAGNYILLVCHSVYATSAKALTHWTFEGTFLANVAGTPDLSGLLTIAGGVAPATIDPTAFTTVVGNKIPTLRFSAGAP